VVATGNHPFWLPQLHRWVEATDLQVGQWLQTSAGTWVQIAAVRGGLITPESTTLRLMISTRTM
jgi:hypothetical protein